MAMTITNCWSITCQHFILLTQWLILTKVPKDIVLPSPVRIRCRGGNAGPSILLNEGGVCAGVLKKKHAASWGENVSTESAFGETQSDGLLPSATSHKWAIEWHSHTSNPWPNSVWKRPYTDATKFNWTVGVSVVLKKFENQKCSLSSFIAYH